MALYRVADYVEGSMTDERPWNEAATFARSMRRRLRPGRCKLRCPGGRLFLRA